jgi:hypothetical protein
VFDKPQRKGKEKKNNSVNTNYSAVRLKTTTARKRPLFCFLPEMIYESHIVVVVMNHWQQSSDEY